MNKHLISYLIFAALALFSACKNQNEKKEEKAGEQTNPHRISLTDAQVKEAGIRTGPLKDTLIQEEIVANGLVDVPPQNFATVTAPMGGFVKTTKVLPGMEVSQGQLLAILEHQDYIQLQQDYLQAFSRFEMAEKEFTRQTELYEGKASSAKKYQGSRADLNSSKASLKALEEKLKLLGINPDKVNSGMISSTILVRSPISGNVKSAHATLGKYVNPSETMYEIVDNSHQHLELKVYEKDILKVKEGQKILFTLPNQDEEQFEGKVYLIGKSLDLPTRTITVHGHLEKEDKKRLLPGMYVNARMITQERRAQLVPAESLILEKNTYFIFRRISHDQNNQVFEKIPVKTGVIGRSWIEVKDPEIRSRTEADYVLSGAYSINAAMVNVGEE